MPASDPDTASHLRRSLAWGVHLFTASGAVFGTLALLRIGTGDLEGAALLMLLTLAIDSADGTMARAVGVSTALPYIDGRRLDDMVDYFNYVIVPMVFLVACDGVLSPVWVAFPILGSAYGFSREDAKTDDDFFLGFPSYWNVVVLYIWLLDLSPFAGTCWIAGLALACFLPIKCLYPSKMKVLRTTTIGLGLLWCALFVISVIAPDFAHGYHLVEISLVYMAWYWGLSFWLGGWKRAAARAAGPPALEK